MTHAPSSEATDQMRSEIQQAGFYPALISDVVFDALDGEEVAAHLVRLETHFDRAEVHRHLTVLVASAAELVLVHIDDEQLDEAGAQVLAQVSVEAIPLSRVRSVVLGYVYKQPQDYQAGNPIDEVTISMAFSGGFRMDVGPATCGDPECDAVHGYSGQMVQEDLVVRVSAEAEGADAVMRAREFGKRLRTLVKQAA